MLSRRWWVQIVHVRAIEFGSGAAMLAPLSFNLSGRSWKNQRGNETRIRGVTGLK